MSDPTTTTELWHYFGGLLRYTKLSDRAWAMACDDLVAIACLAPVQFALPLGFKNYKDIFSMATKKPTQDNDKPKWRGFININLQRSDKADIIAHYERDDHDLQEELKMFLNTGHTISFTYDDKNSCFMAAMRCNNVDSPNAGYCITSRAGSPEMVLKLSMYKHYAMCAADWTQFASDDGGFSFG